MLSGKSSWFGVSFFVIPERKSLQASAENMNIRKEERKYLLLFSVKLNIIFVGVELVSPTTWAANIRFNSWKKIKWGMVYFMETRQQSSAFSLLFPGFHVKLTVCSKTVKHSEILFLNEQKTTEGFTGNLLILQPESRFCSFSFSPVGSDHFPTANSRV